MSVPLSVHEIIIFIIIIISFILLGKPHPICTHGNLIENDNCKQAGCEWLKLILIGRLGIAAILFTAYFKISRLYRRRSSGSDFVS